MSNCSRRLSAFCLGPRFQQNKCYGMAHSLTSQTTAHPAAACVLRAGAEYCHIEILTWNWWETAWNTAKKMQRPNNISYVFQIHYRNFDFSVSYTPILFYFISNGCTLWITLTFQRCYTRQGRFNNVNWGHYCLLSHSCTMWSQIIVACYVIPALIWPHSIAA